MRERSDDPAVTGNGQSGIQVRIHVVTRLESGAERAATEMDRCAGMDGALLLARALADRLGGAPVRLMVEVVG